MESEKKYYTYYTEEDTDERIYIAEEMKRFAMGADDFRDIYRKRFEYKQEVVRHLEYCISFLSSEPSISINKQLYMAEDILHQIRMDLMELVWNQVGEVLIASEVVKLKTIALAEWADRLYSTAKRVERDEMLRKNTANADHWLKIANRIDEVLLGAKNNNKKEIESDDEKIGTDDEVGTKLLMRKSGPM